MTFVLRVACVITSARALGEIRCVDVDIDISFSSKLFKNGSQTKCLFLCGFFFTARFSENLRKKVMIR